MAFGDLKGTLTGSSTNPVTGMRLPVRVHVRAKKGGTSGNAELTVALYQGTTQIASWLVNSLTGSEQTFTLDLNQTQFDSITDPTDLRWRLTANEVA